MKKRLINEWQFEYFYIKLLKSLLATCLVYSIIICLKFVLNIRLKFSNVKDTIIFFF